RSIPTVDEEKAPIGGPHNGGVVFQQLGGLVNVTSGTLGVDLSNVGSSQADGAGVLADAIRAGGRAGALSPGAIDGSGFLGIAGSQTISDVSMSAGSTYRVDFANVSAASNRVDLLTCTTFSTSDTLLTLASSFFSPPSPGTPFRIINNTL